MNYSEEFKLKSEEKSLDLAQRSIIQNNIDNYKRAFRNTLFQFKNLEATKQRAHTIKWRAMENLDKYLPEFESQFQKKGGKVIWANDEQEAQKEILQIIQNAGSNRIIKSKSSTIDELNLSSFLNNHEIATLESDFGDYVIQQLGQKSSHSMNSTLHLSYEEMANSLNGKLATSADTTPEQLLQKFRKHLRHEIFNIDIAISGANYLIAETGTIVLTENEGNLRLISTFPKIHIVVAGIDKIIPNLQDLDLLLPLMSSHHTGQNLATYQTLLNGPKQAGESDGPQEMYVILLDNGRTNLLAQKEQRQGLYDMNSAASTYADPVYQIIGGHSYGTSYSGTISAINTPHLKGLKAYKHLSYASPLDNASNEASPLNIDFRKMLLLNRRDAVQQQLNSYTENLLWKFWTKAMKNRKWMDFFGHKIKKFVLKRIYKKNKVKYLEIPELAPKSFSQQWLELQKKTETQ